MKILFLTPHIPYPKDNGSKIGILNTIQGLEKNGFKVDILSLGKKEELLNKEKLALTLKGKILFVKSNEKFLSILVSILFQKSAIINRFYSKKFAEKLKKISKDYDLIFASHTYMGQYYKHSSITPFFLDIHVLEHPVYELKKSFSKNLLLKIFLFFELPKLKREEINILSNTHYNFCFGEREQSLIKRFGIKKVSLRPIPISNLSFPSRRMDFNKQPIKILFFGDYKWHPNKDAAKYILDNLDKNLINNPKFSILFAGRNADDSLINDIKSQGHIFLGEVCNINELIDSVHFVLAPVRIGGGVRLKIIESMARGKVVITNSIGAEGVIDKKSLIIEDDLSNLESILEKYSNVESSSSYFRIQESAYDYAQKNHSIASSARKLIEEILSKIKQHL